MCPCSRTTKAGIDLTSIPALGKALDERFTTLLPDARAN